MKKSKDIIYSSFLLKLKSLVKGINGVLEQVLEINKVVTRIQTWETGFCFVLFCFFKGRLKKKYWEYRDLNPGGIAI